MNLCIDIGNTKAKYAIFENDKLVVTFKKDKLLVRDVRELKKEFDFRQVILSSTRKQNSNLIHHFRKNYHLIILDQTIALPIDNKYKTPDTLGKDRLAAVIGAKALYPGSANLVIDIGTCITYDLITERSEYLGGNISPGVFLRLKSMNDYTANLPLVEKKKNKGILGWDTESALQNGAVLGTICEIEAFIGRFRENFPDINVILTGGGASFFAEYIKSKIFVRPNLVLIGLNEILKHNEV